MLVPLLPVFHTSAQQEVLVDKVTIARIEDENTAAQSLLNGETQARLFAMEKVDTVNNLQKHGFNIVRAYSGLVDIYVNPAPNCTDGSFNIFADRRARLALQFLIPRDQIATNVYKGAALPTLTSYIPMTPDYPHLLGTLAKWQSLIDSKGKKYGLQLLKEALLANGAQLKNGKWYKDGKPVTVKFIIRTEDKRKDVGNIVADILEKEANLTVKRIYKDFSGAYQIVYRSDPGKCEWSLYTEGWGITGMTQYNYDDAVWYFSSIWGSMPGRGTPGYWNYANKTIDDIAMKLDEGNYTTVDAFYKAINKLIDLGLQESIRAFVVATADMYPFAPGITGYVQSPIVYPWNTYTWLNLHYTTDTIRVSNRYVYKSGWSWNPMGGWQDMYSRPVVDAITWPAVTSRPTDGKTGWSPGHTTTWKVERGPVKVPGDALVYDHALHKFVNASEANVTTAINAVTYNLGLLGKIKFHDGTTESLADLLSQYYMIFEYSFDDSTNTTNDTRYDPNLVYDWYTTVNNFVAIKINNDTSVTVYTNYKSVDDGRIAGASSPWTSFPLELYAAMDTLARTGNYYFDIYNNGEIIHLLSPDQCSAMVKNLQQLKDNPPDWVQQLIKMGYLTMDEWKARVDHLISFYKSYHHLVIGNGPFMLTSYDATNDVATLKRVFGFPVPFNAVAQEVAYKKAELQVKAEELTSNVKGTPIALINVKVNGQPGTKDNVVIYPLLVNLKTFELTTLTLEQMGNGQYKASLPKDMPEGQYQLMILAYPIGYSYPAQYQSVLTLQHMTTTTSTSTTTTTSTSTTSTTSTSTSTTTTTTSTTTTHTTSSTTSSTTTTQSTTQPSQTGTKKGGSNAALWASIIIIIIIIIGAAWYAMKK